MGIYLFNKHIKKFFVKIMLEFTYWEVHGLAQPIRYMLAAAKHEYKETTLPIEDAINFFGGKESDWGTNGKPALAEETPLPNLPFIKDDGLVITQSSAIM